MNSIQIGTTQLDFNKKTFIMGILNVTPDSFSDGGQFNSFDIAVNHALQMHEDGADIIDIGGESTRPGSDSVSLEEELDRVIPVIEKLSKKNILISIDTSKSEVAQAAIKAGAKIVNDISGMTFDAKMIKVVAENNVPVVIMHTADNPKIMQKTYSYDDVVADIHDYFSERISTAIKAGISSDKIILDPGIGFGKSVNHNLQLIRDIGRFQDLGCPILIGASRKSFIGLMLDLPVDDRLEGSLASLSASIINGASIVRVHDVKESVRAARMTEAIVGKTSIE